MLNKNVYISWKYQRYMYTVLFQSETSNSLRSKCEVYYRYIWNCPKAYLQLSKGRSFILKFLFHFGVRQPVLLLEHVLQWQVSDTSLFTLESQLLIVLLHYNLLKPIQFQRKEYCITFFFKFKIAVVLVLCLTL